MFRAYCAQGKFLGFLSQKGLWPWLAEIAAVGGLKAEASREKPSAQEQLEKKARVGQGPAAGLRKMSPSGDWSVQGQKDLASVFTHHHGQSFCNKR